MFEVALLHSNRTTCLQKIVHEIFTFSSVLREILVFVEPYNLLNAAQDLIQSLTTSRSALVLILFSHQRQGLASVLPIDISLS